MLGKIWDGLGLGQVFLMIFGFLVENIAQFQDVLYLLWRQMEIKLSSGPFSWSLRNLYDKHELPTAAAASGFSE